MAPLPKKEKWDLKALDKICKVLDLIVSVITVGIIIFLTLLVTFNVFMRFVFNSPIPWQYEATLVTMSWVVFLGMSITFANDEQMRLTFVRDALPEALRDKFFFVLDIIVILFLIAGFYFSISIVQNAFGTTYQTIPVSKGWFYLPFPIGCLVSILQIINVNLKKLNGTFGKEENE